MDQIPQAFESNTSDMKVVQAVIGQITPAKSNEMNADVSGQRQSSRNDAQSVHNTQFYSAAKSDYRSM